LGQGKKMILSKGAFGKMNRLSSPLPARRPAMNATTVKFEPKSYLSEEEKVGMSEDDIYFYEACKAQRAGDMDSFWHWAARVDSCEAAIKALLLRFTPEFLEEKGFNLKGIRR
jgi:hypothetical protein